MNVKPYETTKAGLNLWKNQLIPQRNAWIAEQIKELFKRCGQWNVEPEIHKLVSWDYQQEVNNRMSFYSMDEIADILFLGAKGELGETGAISSRIVFAWVKTYKNDYRAKLAAFCKPTPILIEESKEPRRLSDEEMEEYILDMYNLYHENGTTYAATFDLLWKYKEIKLSDETIEQLREKAQARVEKIAREKVATKGMSIKDYMNAKELGFAEQVAAESKKLAVAYKFDLMKLAEKPKVK